MQKTTLTYLTLSVLALMLSACEFTVKGEVEHAGGYDPTDPYSPTPAPAYDCSERKIMRVEKTDFGNCSTPGEIDDVVTDINEIDVGTVRITVRRLWDGTYPRLSRIEYRSSVVGYPIRTLGCELLPALDVALNTRTYECILHGELGEASFHDSFKFHRMLLENEFCPAKATYQAKMPDEACYRDGYYLDREYQFDVYRNGQKVPSLYPTDI